MSNAEGSPLSATESGASGAPRRSTSSRGQSIATQAYWDALSRGELLLPHCAGCDTSFFYPRERCPACLGTDIEWRAATGGGTVVASAIARLALNDWPAEDVPYQVLLVELDEGVRMPGRLNDVADASVVGRRVELRFAPEPEWDLPRFHLVGDHV
jgi:uncharacterized OB-fold protein